MQSKREHKTICAIKEPGFGYNGEYTDAATGMIYLRARFYDPSMNRFSQKDALRGNINNPLSLNRYLYCENDPVNFVDSSGRAKKATQSLAGNSYSAAISKTKMTDGGNSQREAAIYGGGSSSAGAKARELARANAVLANTYAPGSKAAQQAQINYSNTVKQTTSGSKSSYTGSNTTYTPVPGSSSAATGTKVKSNSSDQCSNVNGFVIKAIRNSIEGNVGVGMGLGVVASIGPLGVSLIWKHDFLNLNIDNGEITIVQNETKAAMVDFIFGKLGTDEITTIVLNDDEVIDTSHTIENGESDLTVGPSGGVYILIGISGQIQFNVNELIENLEI